MRKLDLSYPLIWGLIAAAFCAATAFGLTMCDDYLYVVRTEDVTNGLSLRGIVFAFTDCSQAIWMPLTYLSYMLDHTLGWGTDGMHLQSILWHGVSASLLYALLLRLFGSRLAALIATLLWAIHPLRVESVVWIASRKDVISTTFLLAALLTWCKATGGWRVVVSGLLIVLGAMAKPSVMVFPVLAFSIDFLITGKRKSFYVYRAFVVLSIVIAVESALCQKAGGATGYSSMIPLWYRIVNAFAAVTVYLGNVFWPTDLGIQCMIRYPDPPYFSILGLALLGGLAAWFVPIACGRVKVYCSSRDLNTLCCGKSTENAAFAGLIVFMGCLVPFLGIAGFGVHAFSDRFTLIPALGISIALCAFISKIPPSTRYKALCTLLLTCAAFLVISTYRQTGYWKDDETLLLHTLKIDREKNIDVHRALALYYWEEKHDLEKVYAHLKTALDSAWSKEVRDTLCVSAHFLIEACLATGRREEADKYYLWFKGIDFKRWGDNRSPEFLMAEALDLIYSAGSIQRERLGEILAALQDFPNRRYIPLTIAYHLSKATGDKELLKRTVDEAAVQPTTGSYFRCRWLHASR